MGKGFKSYFLMTDLSAYGWYRIVGPFKALKKAGFNVKLFSTLQPGYIEDGEVFVLQRISNPNILKFCEWIRKKKKHLVFDLDENFLQISFWTQYNTGVRTAQSYTKMVLEYADVVTAPTSFLATQLKPFSRNVKVIPNFLSEDIWERCEPRKREDFGIGKDEVVIGWAGSEAHLDNLRIVANAVEEIMDKYPNTRLMLLGYDPGFFDIPSERKISIPFQKYSDYISYLYLIDIALVPLKNDLFNKCKSSVKVLEHGMAESAVIASDSVPFKDLKNEGASILLVEDEEEWERSLELLVEDRKKREELASSLKQLVLKRYILEKNLNFYTDLFSLFDQESLTKKEVKIKNI